MIRLEPDWIGELLGQWAAGDWADARQDLGYPTVSPMFKKIVGNVTEFEDVTGYSSAELRAVSKAVDWLHEEHPEHWRALCREFRSWTRKTLEKKDGDDLLVIEAGKLLAFRVDDLLS